MRQKEERSSLTCSRRISAVALAVQLRCPCISLLLKHALFVQIRENTARIVLRLQLAIVLAAIRSLECRTRKVTVGVKGLDAAELEDLVFHQPVEMPDGVRLPCANDIPEAEVHVQFRLHRIQREAARVVLRPDRADPRRPDSN